MLLRHADAVASGYTWPDKVLSVSTLVLVAAIAFKAARLVL